jgi:hypothetical protein
MKHLTVVIRYEDDQQQPHFHAEMECLGGIVTGVQFNDALLELEDAEDLTLELGERD